MKIIVLAVGTKMPDWVETAVREYQKRFPREMQLMFKEIAPVKRNGKNSDEHAKELEGQMILESIPKRSYVVALDERGRQYDSMQLSDRIGAWQDLGMDVVLLVGGPNGLTDECRARASELWSLSKLTLPHPLVRVFLAETLYRAWSIHAGLPYHRA